MTSGWLFQQELMKHVFVRWYKQKKCFSNIPLFSSLSLWQDFCVSRVQTWQSWLERVERPATASTALSPSSQSTVMRWWGSVENHTHAHAHTRSIILMILTNGNMFIFLIASLKKSTFHYLLEHIVQNIMILLWHETVKHYIANNFFSSWMVFKRARISWLLKIDDPLTPPPHCLRPWFVQNRSFRLTQSHQCWGSSS